MKRIKGSKALIVLGLGLSMAALWVSCGDEILGVLDPDDPGGTDPGGTDPGDTDPGDTDPPTGGSVTVAMRDDFFSPRDVTVQPGVTITWQNEGSKNHTSTSDTNLWDSGSVGTGVSWSWTVPSATQLGTDFPYYCIFHGDPGGSGMAGAIHVGDASTDPGGDATVTVTTPGATFSPDFVEILPGETVAWMFSGSTHNVTFEDESPPGGDIPDSPPGTEVIRTFPAEGDYDYECTLHAGQTGRIRVRS